MNDDSILGNTLSQLGGVVKDTAKQVVKLPSEAAEDIEKQIAGDGQNKDVNSQDKQTINRNDSKKQTEEVVGSFYEKSPSGFAQRDSAGQAEHQQSTEDEFRKQIKDKPPEEQKKLLEVRKQFQQLHKETYYDPTFNPPKKQEERPQEKMEKEKEEKKQMEALEFEEKKKKELPPSVKQGTHEKMMGISG